MNKLLFLLALLVCQIGAVQGFEIEGRVAYFLPQDSHIRKVYGSHGYPEYQVEVATPFNLFNKCADECNPDQYGFINFSYFQKHGRSTGCISNKTEVKNWALNFGLKRYFDSCCFRSFRPYLGLGIGVAHVRFHDHSRYVKNHISKYGFALLVKSGVQYDITCNFFLDLFADYGSNWFNRSCSTRCNSTRRINTGGFKIGAGLGYRF